MTTRHDGSLWVANSNGIKVVNASGAVVASYSVSSYSITRGPRDTMWFGSINAFGRIADGAVTEFQLRPPIGQFEHRGITSSADGAIWMTQYNSGPIPPPPTASAQTEESSAGLVRIDAGSACGRFSRLGSTGAPLNWNILPGRPVV
jgi:streptogramin lyase